MLEEKVTTVIINYQTPELTSDAVNSFINFYPSVNIILIDNGSKDNSPEILNALANQYRNIKLVINKKNLHHGPAMHQAISLSRSEYLLFIDSDCKIIQGGFLEKMLEQLENDYLNYAIGEIILLNKRGFLVSDEECGIPYVRPICMMLKREHYKNLKPFQKHGAPCLENMQSAINNGLKILNFEVSNYIFHVGRGTASKFGYNLGLKGKINFLLNKLKL